MIEINIIITLYIIMFLYGMFLHQRSVHMVQQNLYDENHRYLKWIIKNYKESFKLDIVGLILIILFIFTSNIWILLIAIIIYLISIYLFNKLKSTWQNKKPLVYTARIKRLMFTYTIIHLLPIVFIVLNIKYTLLSLGLLISLNFITTYLVFLINYPLEKTIYLYYYRSARKKLTSMDNLKIIGITGSYGKTSCKSILNDILDVNYNTFASPKSINTFNGLMINVNNKLSKYDEVFIAEMGAYVLGEIKRLCKLIRPQYAIITRIGLAHLETFKTEENIICGKMELVESLGVNSVAVLNIDDPKQTSYIIKNKNPKIIWIGIDNECDVRASNIKMTFEGLEFDVKFKDDKKTYHFNTKLLGKHNIYNILSALALANYFQINKEKLVTAVTKLKPVEHRLELKKIGNFYQLDDAYNSNPVGASNALNVLKELDGMKVVVTPGMVELGDKEEEENRKFARHMTEVADKIILVGEKITANMYDEIIKTKYDKNNVYVVDDVRKSYDIINEWGKSNIVYALYENDLPDSYIEKR